MKPAHHRQSTTTIPTQALRIDCSFYMAARKPTSPLRARAPASRKNGGGGPREWISRAGLPSQTPRSPPTFKRPHMGDAHPLVPTIGFQSRSTERLPTANAVGLHAVWPKAARSLPDLDAPCRLRSACKEPGRLWRGRSGPPTLMPTNALARIITAGQPPIIMGRISTRKRCRRASGLRARAVSCRLMAQKLAHPGAPLRRRAPCGGRPEENH